MASKSITEDEKKARAKAFFANGPWYAACPTADNYIGPNRDTYDAAQADATAHDANNHGGVATCGVLDA